MKVSFVVPIYKKTPEQVQKCVKSLLDQSHKEVEVVAVFDGVDPDLEKALDGFSGDSRFSRTTIEHGGACRARNAGFPLTTGDVVAFWDADCYAEPEMARVWVEEFRQRPDVDFVYSGYRFVDPGMQGFESEPFDPWTIHKYNYIASMFPLRRDKFPGWDESLGGLQDWDYWRRVVKAGCKGSFIPGFGWSTDIPKAGDISAATDKRPERIEIVRRKHGDLDKEILVHGATYKEEAIRLAKVLDADVFNNPFWLVRKYKAVMVFGFNPHEVDMVGYVFRDCPKETKKLIYWMGYDAEQFYQLPFGHGKAIVKVINEAIHKNFCDDKRTQDMLRELGVEAEILPLPREELTPLTALPKDFKLLAFADAPHAALMESIIRAVPDVKIDRLVPGKPADIPSYTGVIQILQNPRLEMGTKNMLIHGRYVISNVQAPYAGYIPMDNVTNFKNAVIDRIREMQKTTDINREAQQYYAELYDPARFKKRIREFVPGPVLEVVNA